MSEVATGRVGGVSPLRADALHLMTLAGFALAQPLYDLLGRNAAFFVFHHCEPVDVLLLVALVSLALPLVLAGLLLALPGRRWSVPATLAVLAGLALVPVLGRVRHLPAPAVASLALVGGAAVVWCRARFGAVRLFFHALSPAVVVFPALFLSRPEVAKLLRPEEPPAVEAVDVRSDTPVVLVVFDEFPLISLLDERRQIDAERFPHFAALARQSHWFRNATAVHPWTTQALPAIVTGRYSDAGTLPRAEDHPRSLFTLLAGSHELCVQEDTSLCPAPLNACRRRPGLGERMASLLADLSLVELHLLAPREWAAALPPVDTEWHQFWKRQSSFQDRPNQFRQFLARLTPSDGRPRLHFVHMVLPHTPFSFLPSGKGYGRDAFLPGLGPDKVWSTDAELVAVAQQRHLLQVGYVDRLLGELLARLKETGLYERCLLVVTADHGVSFCPGAPNRKPTAANHVDVLRVPLFVKTPGQRQGGPSDRNVEHIDVMPTIAGVLGVDIPWAVDGQSALDLRLPQRSIKRLVDKARPHHYPADLGGDFGNLDAKLARFGSGPWQRLYQGGKHGGLVGKPVGPTADRPASARVRLHDPEAFRNVAPDSPFVPARVEGSVGTLGEARSVGLAVAVNGVVRAVTEVRAGSGEDSLWAMMVPEESFRPGANEVDVYEVVPGGLARATAAPSALAGLTFERSGDRLSASDGRTFALRKHAFDGYLDLFHANEACVLFAGWTADLKSKALPERVVVLADDRFFYGAPLNAERPDVARVLNEPHFRGAGFNFCIPRDRFRGLEAARFRFFAVGADGTAAELRYHDWYTRLAHRPFLR